MFPRNNIEPYQERLDQIGAIPQPSITQPNTALHFDYPH